MGDMKALSRYALMFSLAVAPFAGAVQLSDLSTTMTRRDADANLTKDYAYRVLSDLTVRRIWNLDENRKLTVDFDPRTDGLVCIMVDYRKPVTSAEGTQDLLALAHADKAAWNKLTDKQAEKYGVRNAKAMKVGEAYVFMECNSAGKCIRVSAFTTKPTASRVHLTDVSMTDIGKTALGSNNSGSAGRALLQDEERRLNTANKTDVAAATEDAGDGTVSKPIGTATAQTATELTDEDDDTEAAAKPKKKGKKVAAAAQGDRGKDLDNMLAKLGMDKLEPIHYIGGAIGIILLFSLIGVMRRQAEAKRLAAQAALLRSGQPNLRPTARRR